MSSIFSFPNRRLAIICIAVVGNYATKSFKNQNKKLIEILILMIQSFVEKHLKFINANNSQLIAEN